jgi:ornithine carbamoyltransferase
MKHFLTIIDTPPEDLARVFDVAFRLRRERQAGQANLASLANKTLAMIFEKPSLRTRVSFEQAMLELGGDAIVLSQDEVGLGTRESPADVARVLSGMVHGIMARVFEHRKLEELAAQSAVPVINALSDLAHPCQALADAMTMMDEFGRDLRGKTLAFVGDGNNVARSLAAICGRLGVRFVIASPPGYELDAQSLARLKADLPDLRLESVRDPAEAVREADAVYTDTWVSMGQEGEKAKRRAAFEGYQVSEQLLARAPRHAIVLHCLPAYRGSEITDGAMESPSSRVFPQAHNRLHAQKGLLAVLLAGER